MGGKGAKDLQEITLSSIGGYISSEPYLKDSRVPLYTPGEKFDVLMLYSVPTLIKPAPDGGTLLDHFNFEGADLGTPNFYRKMPLSADKTLAWKQRFDVALPPETDEIESFDNPNGEGVWTNADLTTEPATLYLMRWDPVVATASGVFSMRQKQSTYDIAPIDLYYELLS